MPQPLSRRRMKEIARLRRRRYREDAGQFVVEGARSVESAILAGAPLIEIIVTRESLADPRLEDLLQRADAAVFEVKEADLQRLADTRSPQGVIAVAHLRRAESIELEPPIVALDGVQDPGNVGTIIRTAAWFGVSGLLAGPATADPFSPKTVRATMGGLWDVRICESGNLVEALADYRARGLALHGADLDGASAAQWRAPREAVLVLGSEAHGLSPAVRELLDERVWIRGGEHAVGVESLNASVAAGILLHRWLG